MDSIDLETIDDSQNNLPAEVIVEMKAMSKWMTFTAVLVIIFGILGLLGNLSTLNQIGGAGPILSIITGIFGIYLAFMVLKKSNLFSSYADNHSESTLIEALSVTKTYWMYSTVLMLISILMSFVIR